MEGTNPWAMGMTSPAVAARRIIRDEEDSHTQKVKGRGGEEVSRETRRSLENLTDKPENAQRSPKL